MASPYDVKYSNIANRVTFYANKYGIAPNVGIWQIWQESRFNPTVCSSAGACGIAQFISDTARRYGVDRNNVESSLDGWGRYMRDLLAMFNGRIDIALAGYNSGENRTEYKNAAREGRPINWLIMPAGVKSETQNYVKTILANAGTNAMPTQSGIYNAGQIATVDVPISFDDESGKGMVVILALLAAGLLL